MGHADLAVLGRLVTVFLRRTCAPPEQVVATLKVVFPRLLVWEFLRGIEVYKGRTRKHPFSYPLAVGEESGLGASPRPPQAMVVSTRLCPYGVRGLSRSRSDRTATAREMIDGFELLFCVDYGLGLCSWA